MHTSLFMLLRLKHLTWYHGNNPCLFLCTDRTLFTCIQVSFHVLRLEHLTWYHVIMFKESCLYIKRNTEESCLYIKRDMEESCLYIKRDLHVLTWYHVIMFKEFKESCLYITCYHVKTCKSLFMYRQDSSMSLFMYRQDSFHMHTGLFSYCCDSSP